MATNGHKYECQECGMVYQDFTQLSTHQRKYCVDGRGTLQPNREWERIQEEKRFLQYEQKMLDTERMEREKQERRDEGRELRHGTKYDRDEGFDRHYSQKSRNYRHKGKEDRKQDYYQYGYEDERLKRSVDVNRNTERGRRDGKREKYNDLATQRRSKRNEAMIDRNDNQSMMSDRSISIHLSDDEADVLQTERSNRTVRFRQLADKHGQKMEYHQRKQKHLNKQKEEIQQKLNKLGANQGQPKDRVNLLADLKEQVLENEKALNELRQQLAEARADGKQTRKQYYDYGAPENRDTLYKTNSLATEIGILRENYLKQGGRDPDVLGKMNQMQMEAQKIEESTQEHHLDDKRTTSRQLQVLESENDKLKQELNILREKSVNEGKFKNSFVGLQEEQLKHILQLQSEIETLKKRHLLERSQRNGEEGGTERQIRSPYNDLEISHTEDNVESDLPWLLRATKSKADTYDEKSGFLVFIDFILNLDASVTMCRLTAGLFDSNGAAGEAVMFPTVYTEPASRISLDSHVSNAVIGARLPVAKCPANPGLGLVAELQASKAPSTPQGKAKNLKTQAWTKIPIFGPDGQLLVGKHLTTLKELPIQPTVAFDQLVLLNEFGLTEVYYRILHNRDVNKHVSYDLQLTSNAPKEYNPLDKNIFLANEPGTLPLGAEAINLGGDPGTEQVQPETAYVRQSITEKAIDVPKSSDKVDVEEEFSKSISLKVDRVKWAEIGEAKVRLTAYNASTGKVAMSKRFPVTCTTSSIPSDFKYGYHVFGEQEAFFEDVQLHGDMMLIARLYLKKTGNDNEVKFHTPQDNAASNLTNEENLVAWAAIPFIISTDLSLSSKARRIYNPAIMKVNAGTHDLQLYYPPVPAPSRLPFEDIPVSRGWKKYRKGMLRIHIDHGDDSSRPLTPSELTTDEEKATELAKGVFILVERKTPPREPFYRGDWFDLYIDSGRFYPDSVTFTKVSARLFDRKLNVYGHDVNTSVRLDSDIFNPVYDDKTEFREPDFPPPSSTFLFKVYTSDVFSKKLTVMGYASLNLFVERGTDIQPNIDKPGVQICLNEGAHQLRLYSQMPNLKERPLTEAIFRESGIRIVPCASLLVRLVRIQRDTTGQNLFTNKTAQPSRPKYSDGVYFSERCIPSAGEKILFTSLMKRPQISIREAVGRMAQAKESFIRSNDNIHEFIRNKLTRAIDKKPGEIDMNFIAQYDPEHGIKVAVDGGLNIPWLGFTLVQVCLNPPGAFYMGAPQAAFDKPVFCDMLDMESTNTSPVWKDGFKHFPHRSYHPYLTVIIHLQEVVMSVSKDTYKYGLREQAWTAVQVFEGSYALTEVFQLPLFHGSPTPVILEQIAEEPLREWMIRNQKNKNVNTIRGASVFVRLADARRYDELPSDIAVNKKADVNTEYLPVDQLEFYGKETPGKPLNIKIPAGKSAEQFTKALAIKFKNLVYKLYESGS